MSADSSQEAGIPSLRSGTAEWADRVRSEKTSFLAVLRLQSRPLSAAVHHSANDDCILYGCLGRQTSDAEIRGRDGPA